MEKRPVYITNETKQYAMKEMEGLVRELQGNYNVADAEKNRWARSLAQEVVTLGKATDQTVTEYKKANGESNMIFMCMEQIRSRILLIGSSECDARFPHPIDPERLDVVVIRD